MVENNPSTTVGRSGLQYDGITKDYGTQRVLHDLNLDVVKGEFLTLLGPSGSGKTTTLMIAAGLTAPTQGRIWLGGSDITRLPPYRRKIGIVFQNYALFPHKTADENVAFPLRMRHVSREETRSRVERALELVRLEGLGRRYPRQLSGGQQQRVALARALVFEPELVLMDEPLGALDKKLRSEMQIELKRLHEELGLTVVYVTHDQEEALSMSDRVAVMREGVIEQLDRPHRIYTRPATEFVATFVGDTCILDGRLSKSGEIAELELVGGQRVAFDHTRVGTLAPGPVAVAVRAEHVQIHDSNASGGAPEGVVAMDGTVQSTIYVGGAWRVELQLGNGEQLRGYWQENGTPIPDRGNDARAIWSVRDAWLVGRR